MPKEDYGVTNSLYEGAEKPRLARKREQQRCMEDTLTQPTSRGKKNSPSFS